LYTIHNIDRKLVVLVVLEKVLRDCNNLSC
jgi:hypothetical protein